jgi:hypothetical protein
MPPLSRTAASKARTPSPNHEVHQTWSKVSRLTALLLSLASHPQSQLLMAIEGAPLEPARAQPEPLSDRPLAQAHRPPSELSHAQVLPAKDRSREDRAATKLKARPKPKERSGSRDGASSGGPSHVEQWAAQLKQARRAHEDEQKRPSEKVSYVCRPGPSFVSPADARLTCPCVTATI